MGAFFVILPILVVAGAFMWLRPSQRDQYLAKLRSDALINGLKISSLKVPDTSEYGRVENLKAIVTLYEQTLEFDERALCRFTVIRTTGEAGVYLPEGWLWQERQALNDNQYDYIAKWLVALPTSVSAVHLDASSVGVSWDEKDPEISFQRLKDWLNQLSEQFNRKVIGQ